MWICFEQDIQYIHRLASNTFNSHNTRGLEDFKVTTSCQWEDVSGWARHFGVVLGSQIASRRVGVLKAVEIAPRL